MSDTPLLYLIRHPHTQADPAAPSSAWGLSAQGADEVRALVAAPFWSDVTAVYTSDQLKTSAVGKAVQAAHGVPWAAVPGLCEATRDIWLGWDRFRTAQQAFFAQPDLSPVEGWESAHEADARIAAAVNCILVMHPPDETLAVVSHATVLTLYTARLYGEPPTYDRWSQIGFAAVMAVERSGLRPLTSFLTAPYDGLP